MSAELRGQPITMLLWFSPAVHQLVSMLGLIQERQREGAVHSFLIHVTTHTSGPSAGTPQVITNRKVDWCSCRQRWRFCQNLHLAERIIGGDGCILSSPVCCFASAVHSCCYSHSSLNTSGTVARRCCTESAAVTSDPNLATLPIQACL